MFLADSCVEKIIGFSLLQVLWYGEEFTEAKRRRRGHCLVSGLHWRLCLMALGNQPIILVNSSKYCNIRAVWCSEFDKVLRKEIILSVI